jgi:hypothetical protein
MRKNSESLLETVSRIGLAIPLIIAVAAFLFLVRMELLGFTNIASEIDQYYFSACAVRGLDLGQIPIAACHDNKGPLIYLLYEIVFALAGAYNFLAIKSVALVLLLLDIALLSWTAFRLAGMAAAAMTAALMLLGLSSDVAFLAFKTELAGGIFLTAALLVLSAPQAGKSASRLALAGLFVGIAVTAKQLYAFSGFAVIVWLFLSQPVRSFHTFGKFLARSLLFGGFVLVPFALFWLAFARQSNSADYFASFFLYPSVYGSSGGGGLANILRRTAAVMAGLTDHTLLVLMTAAAAVTFIIATPSRNSASAGFSDPRWLFILVVLFLLTALIMSPVWFAYYVVLLVGPMVLLSGTIFGDWWDHVRQISARAAATFIIVFCVGSMLVATRTWQTNGMRDIEAVPARPIAATPAGASTRYAYEFGEQPDFYAAGHYIPASSIQFPWALPGTPERWSYKRPPSGTFVARMLAADQARNLAQLYADFARTPPSYVMLQSDFVRNPNSPNAIDIPGFQDYLDRHCRLLKQAELRPAVSASLYGCTDAAKQSEAN